MGDVSFSAIVLAANNCKLAQFEQALFYWSKIGIFYLHFATLLSMKHSQTNINCHGYITKYATTRNFSDAKSHGINSKAHS
jgi:hypothetical protein